MRTISCMSIFVCLVLSAPAFPATTTEAALEGISPDGRYLAYREYGVADGSGIPFNEHRIVDVDKNSFIGKKYGADDREYRRLLRKYNISPANKATLLFMSKENHDLNSLLYSCKFKYANKSYGLKLTEYDAPQSDGCGEEPPVGSYKKMELALQHDTVSQSLQKDGSLPPARKCVLGYSIRSVQAFKGRIIVFLEYYTMGFEGPDINKLIITGVIR